MERGSPETAGRHEILACLGVPSRFKLVLALAKIELCVTELASELGLSQSCTTRHLQALGRLGLVEGRREGKRVRFRLKSSDAHTALIRWLLSQNQAPSTIEVVPARERGQREGEARRRGTPLAGEPGSGDGKSEARKESPGQEEKPMSAQEPRPRSGDLEDYLL